MTDDSDLRSRRSVLKTTGAGLAMATGLAGTASASDGPSAPELDVVDRTDTTVRLKWDFPDGEDVDHVEIDVYEYSCGYGGCSPDEYLKTEIGKGTLYRVEELRPNQYYGFHVRGVDSEGNKGAYEDIMWLTDAMLQPVHTPDSWSDEKNELGGKWKAEHFENGDGTVTDDGLYLDYDGTDGIFSTYFADPEGDGAWEIENHDEKAIKFLLRGDKGDEQEDAKMTWNASENTEQWNYYVGSDSVGTEQSVLSIKLEHAWSFYGTVWSIDTPENLVLEFGQESDRDSGVTIESVWVSDYDMY